MGRAIPGLAAACAVLSAVLPGHVLAAPSADQPTYGPPPAWVKDVPIPTDGKPTGAAVDLLLLNNQQRLTPGIEEQYNEVVARVNASEGLAGLGNLIETWDPSTQTLAIHKARIIRGGQTIDLIAAGKRFTVIRRETGLEAATIDGRLTATLQPEDLRVGDILDLAVSFTRREPALKDHSEAAVITAHQGVIHHLVVRTSWLKSRAPKIFKSDDLPPLVRTDAGDRVEIGFEQTDVVSPERPKGAPPFESTFGVALMSDFADWPDLSRTLYPLFDKTATLSPTSPLQAQIAAIAKAHPDAKGRALAALELVESDVRYLALFIDAGGLTPAPADLTWSRRYGDCKGKTVLLLGLLRGLGVEATPALVSTKSGDGLDRIPAIAAAFDHVMVRAIIGGKVYWLDATRQGDDNLDAMDVPNFHFALPLTREGAGLVPLVPRTPTEPYIETKMSADLTAGLDKPAKIHRETILRGDLGLAAKLALSAASPTDRDRGLRDLLKGGRDWITPDKLDWTYDSATMTFTGKLDGTGAPPFTSPGGGDKFRDWTPVENPVEISPDLRRTTDYHKDAPYAVAYPSFSRDEVEIRLPDNGRGFTVRNQPPIDETAAGVHYSRTVSFSGGRFEAVVSRRALQPRFPASEAERAENQLKTLNSYDVELRYDPVQAAKGARADKAMKPADEARKRGQTALTDGDPTAAEAAFTEALAASPDAKTYEQRAVVREQLGKIIEARADFASALKLDPKQLGAILSLGNIALSLGDFDEAKRQFEAAVAAAPNRAQVDGLIQGSYDRAKRLPDVIAWTDRRIADLPKRQPPARRSPEQRLRRPRPRRPGPEDRSRGLRRSPEAAARRPGHPRLPRLDPLAPGRLVRRGHRLRRGHQARRQLRLRPLRPRPGRAPPGPNRQSRRRPRRGEGGAAGCGVGVPDFGRRRDVEVGARAAVVRAPKLRGSRFGRTSFLVRLASSLDRTPCDRPRASEPRPPTTPWRRRSSENRVLFGGPRETCCRRGGGRFGSVDLRRPLARSIGSRGSLPTKEARRRQTRRRSPDR